jgi:hypothetical protein
MKKYVLQKKGKGQFFIISAVIIASILLVVSNHFSSFSAISLTGNAEISELEYIRMIKDSLKNTAAFSTCDRLDEDISSAEYFLSGKLAEQGIELSANHQIISCNNIKFNFNLSSGNFFSSTEFNYP